MLLAALPPNTTVGGGRLEVPQCPHLDADAGKQACDAYAKPDYCGWSWRDFRCEEDTNPPGVVYADACSQNLDKSCARWSDLGTVHPFFNCDIVQMCPKNDDQ